MIVRPQLSPGVRPQHSMRAILLFVGTAVLSGALMVATVLLELPVAFATQGGVGFRAAPLRSAVVLVGGYLLAPIAWLGAVRGSPSEWGFGSILVLSIAYGLLALAVRRAWATRRRHRERAG
jgi:hypothetical protein